MDRNDPFDPWTDYDCVPSLYDDRDRVQTAKRDDQQHFRYLIFTGKLQSQQFQRSDEGNGLLEFPEKQFADFRADCGTFHCDPFPDGIRGGKK